MTRPAIRVVPNVLRRTVASFAVGVAAGLVSSRLIPRIRPSPPLANVAGSVYATVIGDQLTQLRALKASLEQRALAVITTSGALVTLLFAFSGVTTSVKEAVPKGLALAVPTRTILAAAAGLFVIAVILALAVNDPRQYHELEERDLQRIRQPRKWNSSNTARAAQRVAKLQDSVIRSFRKRNNQKAWILRFAIVAEVAAVVALGVAVGTVLFIG